MLDHIKEGDFVLIRHKKSPNECRWVYVKENVILELRGIVLKHNLKTNIYRIFDTYHFNSSYWICEKITNNKEIEELSFIYKLYLLTES